MIENTLGIVKGTIKDGTQGWVTAKAVSVKIDLSVRVPGFEQIFLMGFLKEFNMDFVLDTYEVSTYKGCMFFE